MLALLLLTAQLTHSGFLNVTQPHSVGSSRTWHMDVTCCAAPAQLRREVPHAVGTHVVEKWRGLRVGCNRSGGHGSDQGPSAGSTCPRSPTDACGSVRLAAPRRWVPTQGRRARKRVGTQWVEQSKTQPGSITLTVYRAATPRQRHEQSLSPAALAARHPGTDHRCWPGAARCRASLRSAVQLGDVSGAVRRWDHPATIRGRVRGARG